MKRYLIFALVSPFVGGLLLLLNLTYQSGYWTQTNVGEVGKLAAVFFKSLQYNYLFGLLPALMMCAVDDILVHVKRIGPALRILLVGLIAFVLAGLAYAASGPVQWLLYGLVGFVPSALSAWLVHRYVEEPQPAAAAA